LKSAGKHLGVVDKSEIRGFLLQPSPTRSDPRWNQFELIRTPAFLLFLKFGKEKMVKKLGKKNVFVSCPVIF